jgi:hypothetical protein
MSGCPDAWTFGALGRYIFRFRNHCLFEIKLIRAIYLQVKIAQNRKMTHQSQMKDGKKEYFLRLFDYSAPERPDARIRGISAIYISFSGSLFV